MSRADPERYMTPYVTPPRWRIMAPKRKYDMRSSFPAWPRTLMDNSWSRYRETEMLTPSRRLMFFLAAVSVVGILSMHGFDPVVATADQHHGSRASGIETGGVAHAALGLCVFVAAVAALGLALVKQPQHPASPANLGYPPRRFLRSQAPTLSGPRLPYRLCVLRL